jgi:small subunit ribosomal protein S8
MSHTDPIADMLTRIRNGLKAKHRRVDIPASGIKKEIARVLARERFIDGVKFIDDRKQGLIRVYLKYAPGEKPVIAGIKRVSTPGLRRYASSDEMPRVLGGLGISIVSTSQGIMTSQECKAKGIGGEVLCNVW